MSRGPAWTVVVLALVASTPVAAQSLLGQRDSKEPIDITSDTLTVEQNQQRATFAGSVDAVQGDMALKADRLVVHYARAAQPVGAPTPRPDAPIDEGQSIRRIEAFGNVVITSPKETAKGDSGVYEVPAGTVVLNGNVILTQGKNIVRGTQLDMDLNSGVSKITAGPTGGKQRVRAVFVPQGKDGEKKEP